MSDRLTPLSEHLYRFDDTCNVYLLTDGAAGLLIDAGSGAVLDHLRPAGVERVEWVLLTHHHRDQFCAQGKLYQLHAMEYTYGSILA